MAGPDLDLRLLNDYQRNFPLVSRPFASIADDLGVTEAEVIARYAGLQAAGLITRVGAVVRPHALGVSTLAAVAVPAEEVDKIGRRTDTWALGVILYELCTLKQPFAGKDIGAILNQIIVSDVVEPVSANPARHVPAELSDIVMKCLQREPAERYESVNRLAKDVEDWLEGVAPWREVAPLPFELACLP